MKAVRSVLDAIVHLFIDDWAVTALTVAWIGLGTLLLRFAVPNADARAPLFFLGFCAILIGSAARSAARPPG
jgi:hypothetical protein